MWGLPGPGVYDPGNGYVYVANTISGTNASNVSVISGTRLVGSVDVGKGPFSGTYDAKTGYVYFVNEFSNNVSIIDGAGVIGTVAVGSVAGYYHAPEPTLITYDGRNGFVYVADQDSGNVSVINDTSLLGTVRVGGSPVSPTYDSENGFVYVPIEGHTVSIINGTTVIGTVPVGTDPSAVAYDSSNGYIYVVDSGSNSVSILDGIQSLGSVSVGSAPNYATYDGGHGIVYVTNPSSNSVSAIQTGYNATFAETGLPSGTPWAVTLNGTPLNTTTSSIVFSEPNGTYQYLVEGPNGSIATDWNGTIDVAGTPISVAVPFVSASFRLWFNETGLPTGSTWSVGAFPAFPGGEGVLQAQPFPTSSDTSSISFELPTGLGVSFGVGALAGFSPQPPSGYLAPFASMGASMTERIAFVANTTVRFTEAGVSGNVPSASYWSVSVVGTGAFSGSFSNHSAGSEIGFGLPLGFTGSFSVSQLTLNTTQGPTIYVPGPGVRPVQGTRLRGRRDGDGQLLGEHAVLDHPGPPLGGRSRRDLGGHRGRRSASCSDGRPASERRYSGRCGALPPAFDCPEATCGSLIPEDPPKVTFGCPRGLLRSSGPFRDGGFFYYPARLVNGRATVDPTGADATEWGPKIV